MAADADDKRFLAHSCCSRAIRNVWYDKLNPEQSRIQDQFCYLLAVLSLGLLAPWIVKFRTKPVSVCHFFMNL
jgi:hypothetical protein